MNFWSTFSLSKTLRLEFPKIYQINTNRKLQKNSAFYTFSARAQKKCMHYIDKLTLPDHIQYRELEKYCGRTCDFIENYNLADYRSVETSIPNNYLDDIVTLPKIICVDDDISNIEKKWHISKLNKENWNYYKFEFEYLRSVFSKCVYKEILDISEQWIEDVFDSFTILVTFCATNGKGKAYEPFYNQIDINEKLKYFYFDEDYWDNTADDGVNISKINLYRYFYYNLRYLFNTFCQNPIFTETHKKCIKEYIEYVLSNICNAIHSETFYQIFGF